MEHVPQILKVLKQTQIKLVKCKNKLTIIS